jgi:hypothetical protein
MIVENINRILNERSEKEFCYCCDMLLDMEGSRGHSEQFCYLFQKELKRKGFRRNSELLKCEDCLNFKGSI